MTSLAFALQDTGPSPKAIAIPRILVAEDNESMLALLVRNFRRDGYDVVEARSGTELMRWVDQITNRRGAGSPVDLIVTDIRMPGHSGQECLDVLQARRSAIPVIVITGFGDDLAHRLAYAAGARAVFDKPLDLVHLRRAVQVLL